MDIGADEYTAAPAYSALKLTSLNGGERIAAGEPYLITWGAPAGTSDFQGLVLPQRRVELGVAHADAAASDARRLSWLVPQLAANATRCLVKISGVLNGRAVIDMSDKPFTVEVVRLMSPNGKEHSSPGM